MRNNQADPIIQRILSMFSPDVPEWEPTETHPVRRKYEIKDHDKKIETLKTQIRLHGGNLK